MIRRHFRLLFALCMTLSASVQAQTTSLASVSSGGAQGDRHSSLPALSADGTCIAFTSAATNLVPGPSNGWTLQVFVHLPATGQTSLVSASSAGVQADESCSFPSVSQDGRYIAFSGRASNLVPGDSNAVSDVFVHDRVAGQTSRVSVGPSGVEGNGSSYWASISEDGRFVAFVSTADNLVPGDTNNRADTFVHDRLTGQTRRASVDSSGNEGNEDCYDPFLSGDGVHVAFYSTADNLVANDSNGQPDIFVHDLQTGQTTRVSVDSAGAEANGGSWTPTLSSDGRFVAFHSFASNLVAGDTAGIIDAFVHDRATGLTTRVSLDSQGAPANGTSEDVFISPDGRFVAFTSWATNLVPGDTNNSWDIFVHDRLSGHTARASVDSTGLEADDFSFSPVLSSNGDHLAFDSEATNLVPGDVNGFTDVFFRDRTVASDSIFCLGDGSGTPCPCGNTGAIDQGCANSTGSGATLGAQGSSSVNADDLVFNAQNLVPNQPTLLFVGQNAINNGDGITFGDGLRCVGMSVVRLGVMVPDGSGAASWGPALGVQGGWADGDTRYFQCWYRDPVNSACGSQFNLSNAYELIFTP